MGKYRSHGDPPPGSWLPATLMWVASGGLLAEPHACHLLKPQRLSQTSHWPHHKTQHAIQVVRAQFPDL